MEILRRVAAIRAALDGLAGGNVLVEAFGPLYTARVGRADARRHIVVTAGLHAAELPGVAAAIEVVGAAKAADLEDVCFHVAPAIDVAKVERNALDVLAAGRIAALLELSSPRDFEGRDWDDACEAEALRDWLDTIGRVDAYLSFHSASCLAGGAFFYVQGEGARVIGALRREVTERGIPLLARDPTPMPSHAREPGFFELDDLGRGALAHVVRRFAPQVAVVSEIPVGLVAGDPSAEECAAITRAYLAGDVEARLIRPEDHVRCLVTAAMSVG